MFSFLDSNVEFLCQYIQTGNALNDEYTSPLRVSYKSKRIPRYDKWSEIESLTINILLQRPG